MDQTQRISFRQDLKRKTAPARMAKELGVSVEELYVNLSERTGERTPAPAPDLGTGLLGLGGQCHLRAFI